MSKKSKNESGVDSEVPAPFDQRLEQLERIAAELEQGDLGLEQALERYQQGVALLKSCHAQLAGFRQRVEELTRAASPTSVPFEDDPDVPRGA